jgi:deoxyribonuclease I
MMIMINGDILESHLEELRLMKECDIDVLVAELKENQHRIMSHTEMYYDASQDESWMEHYYCNVSFKDAGACGLAEELKELVGKTHKYRQPYYAGKDQYLYTWVDLQPYGELKNIYSGTHSSPESVIMEDVETIHKRYDKYMELVEAQRHSDLKLIKQLRMISKQHKFNVEHVVPQSWFRAREPMKGDLHHLFTCEPKCNRLRSNYPYYEFSSGAKSVVKYDNCGLYDGLSRFEPEYGKGIAARAMFYFLLRYPNTIEKSFRKTINRRMLLKWHHQFPVTVYEQHRNKAIFEIQGNRNPFIDFPELAEIIASSFLE